MYSKEGVINNIFPIPSQNLLRVQESACEGSRIICLSQLMPVPKNDVHIRNIAAFLQTKFHQASLNIIVFGPMLRSICF